MTLLFASVVSLIAFFVLVAFGANTLFGAVVHGVARPVHVPTDTHPILLKQYQAARRRGFIATGTFALLTIGYIVAILQWWNIGAALAAAMVMAGRLPDILWEAQTGERLDPKAAPRGPLYYAATGLTYAAFPILFGSVWIAV